jgi:sec-independent protein translocase protein TatC
MSFLEHLEELRKRLIISVIALVICTGIAWPLVSTVQEFITRPLQEPSITQKWSYVAETWMVHKFPQAAKRLALDPQPPRVMAGEVS